VSAGRVDYTGDKEGIYVDKFLYYHVKIDTLKVPRNTWVNSDSLIAKIAHYSSGDHVHFNDGRNQQEVNPLREYGINPFTDNSDPIFYPDPITLREDDPNVGGWNGGADGALIDKDSVYGNVDIIVHAKDEINAGYRVGLYALSYQVCNRYCTPIANEVLNFSFDNWYDNYYVNFIYQEPFYYIITNKIDSNGYWKTTDLYDGTYCLRIRAYDIVSFYKKFVLKDTSILNVTEYFLQDIKVKNGIQGNNDPEIVGHIHCKYPFTECNDCIKYGDQFTLEIIATDQDGDSMYYEWFSYWGWFIVNGQSVYACTTAENYVTYQAPIFYPNYDRLDVIVHDVRGGSAFIEGLVGIYAEATKCLCGDVTKDLIVDTSDLVFLINYLFAHGPSFDPTETGDVKNDCLPVDASDLIYLLNYLFAHGPQPKCCWIH
jgi:hypothetical protein